MGATLNSQPAADACVAEVARPRRWAGAPPCIGIVELTTPVHQHRGPIGADLTRVSRGRREIAGDAVVDQTKHARVPTRRHQLLCEATGLLLEVQRRQLQLLY